MEGQIKNSIYTKACEAADYIRSLYGQKIQIGLSLGTGSSSIVDSISSPVRIAYSDIPHFPHTAVKSHKNELVIGKLGSKNVLCLAGRMHYYEGWSMEKITFPMRVMQQLGVKQVIMSNAAGGTNPHYSAGDIVIVKDHINLLPEHPLRGKNDDRLGIRFPDMKKAYDKGLRNIAKEVASSLSLNLREGVYVGLQGPSLETPAEYKFLNVIGGDLVGMSTVPDVIVAKHCEIPVLVFSIVTNECFPIENITETTVDEVIAVANKSAKVLSKLVEAIVEKL